MFRNIRIAFLLYILLFVALGTWITRTSSTDWEQTLWVNVYPINGDGSAEAEDYIEHLSDSDFSQISEFLSRETRRYGHAADDALKIYVGPIIPSRPPQPPASGNWLGIAGWSLSFRYWAWRATRDDQLPTPDVKMFMVFFHPDTSVALEPSLGLSKGMIGIVNAFASRRMAGSNQLVVAHELLHTLGATDKYDPHTNLPTFPHGYADPDRSPLFPQPGTEVMGGRRAVSATVAEIPDSLSKVTIGRATAQEIRLLKAH